MAENKGFYDVYDYGDRLEPADRMKIEHSISISDENTDISKLTPLSVEQLQTMRGESAAAEQVIFDKLREATAEWEAQAAQTRLLDKAVEYNRTPAVQHSSNQWVINDVNNDRQNMSNMVYAMTYYVYERTRYDRATEKSVPVAWELSWSVHTNAPSNQTRQRIAGQSKKVYSDKADMERYLNGRITAYSHLFTELSPPVPQEYADSFRVNGQLLPGYTVEGEEPKPPDRAADVAAPGVTVPEENNDLRKERENMNEPLNIQLANREQYITRESGSVEGAWLKLPATAEQFNAELARIGAQGGELGTDYFINGFDTPVTAVSRLSLETVQKAGIDELNYLAAALQSRDNRQIDKLNAATEIMADVGDIHRLAELTQNTGVYDFHPDIFNNIQLGEYTMEHSGLIQIPEEWEAAIDFEMLGQLAAASEKGLYTEYGYIVPNGEEWKPVTEIPQEYRISPPERDYDAIATRAPAVATVKPPEQAQPQPQPVIPLVLNAEKPAEKLKEITDKLEQGIKDIFNSEQYESYLKTMSKFYNYSINNTMLIAMQKPDATLIAGFNAWKSNFERSVKKGEKGIKIIAPSPFKVKEEREKIDPQTQRPVIGRDGKPVTEEVEIKIPAYKVVSVFDVSQTDGKELPSIGADELTGSVDKYKDFFAALEKTSTVPIGFEEIKTGANGYYHLEDKRIALREGMSELQTLKTAIHEIAHSRLHDIDVNDTKDEQPRADKRTREVEAESIAYTVCQHYGLDTSDYSFGYVAGWSSDKELAELKASLETIRGTAAGLITEIDGHFAELQKDRETEQSRVFDSLTPEQQQALSNEVQATLQFFVDSDIQTHGEVTESTLEAVAVQGYEYRDGKLEKAAAPERQPGHEEWSEPATAENAPDNPGVPSDDINKYLPEQGDTFSIYQLKRDDSTRDFRFEPLDRLQNAGLAVDPANYELVYTAPITADTGDLEQIFDKFNIDRPEDFKGHSLSVSDVVTLNRDGKETAHYVDRSGYKQVPQFLQPTNYLETAEKSTEQNYNMIDGIMNNTPTVDELEARAKAGEPINLLDLANAVKAERNAPARDTGKKPSIRKELAECRAQLAKDKDKPAPDRVKNKAHDLEV